MGKTRIKNSNALIDFFARNKEHAEACGCYKCRQALRSYRDFYLGKSGKHEAFSSAQKLVEEHGWR